MQLICNIVPNTDENTYVYFDENTKDGVIVDPGVFSTDLLTKISEEGINIQGILLTHGHYDHIFGALEYKDFYGCKIYSGEKEQLVTNDPSVSFTERFDSRKFIADVLLKEDETFEVGSLKFKAISTPGHTPGGVCYLDELQGVMFSGDTLFKGTYGRTDFPMGSFEDLKSSLERLFELDADIDVYPGHYEPTSIGFEKATNRMFH